MPSQPAAGARIIAMCISAIRMCNAALGLIVTRGPDVKYAVLADALREVALGLHAEKVTARVVGATWDEAYEAGRQAGYEQALAEMTPRRGLRRVV